MFYFVVIDGEILPLKIQRSIDLLSPWMFSTILAKLNQSKTNVVVDVGFEGLCFVLWGTKSTRGTSWYLRQHSRPDPLRMWFVTVQSLRQCDLEFNKCVSAPHCWFLHHIYVYFCVSFPATAIFPSHSLLIAQSSPQQEVVFILAKTLCLPRMAATSRGIPAYLPYIFFLH